MLKILDSSGEVVGVLEDEDSAPDMKKAKKEAEEGVEDGVEGLEQGGTGSPEAKTEE